ncbi:cobaltochelatase CobT-related protein [Salinisphaera aquimarina]|uniref:Cobalt chelatase n=1 Tax=Salinisphaera aquimarina TaxID=2094031 RepID=A0ABV7EPU0_9GAMM
MSTTQQLLRRQQRIEALCAASLRALTGDRRLHYRSHRLHRDARVLAVHAPHLRLADDRVDFESYRGVADAVALRLLYSDDLLHRSLCPESSIARLIFELLEQLRVEAKVPAGLPGMRHNLATRFVDWSHTFHRSGFTEGEVGCFVYVVAQMCRERLTGEPFLEETEVIVETLRGELAPELGHALAALKRHRHDQAAFAEPALEIAHFVAGHVARQREAQGVDTSEPDEEGRGFELLLDFTDEDSEAVETVVSGRSRVFNETGQQYRIFTTAYDQQQSAEDVVRAAQLMEFRERLDRGVRELDVNMRRLARLFSATLAVPERDGWQFGEEEGYIDGRRLAQVVSSPAERRVFRIERHVPRVHCQVSFLIDCSGSMKAHGEFVALLIDVLARALEIAGAATEILGFTTSAWSGGRAQQTWMRAGRPAHPGRLNEVRYLVFKDAERRWRTARRGIGALLRPDLYREGVDGEAVSWACERMVGREDRRRILVVISDGCPSDSATDLANDRFYLDNHLKDVVDQRERQGEIAIRGLGVGLDLSSYYRDSLVVDPDAPLNTEILLEIVELIVGARPRR